MSFRNFSLLITTILFSNTSFAGMHDNWKDGGGSTICMFQSSIDKTDLVAFRKNLESGCSQLIVSSDGGDLETAIAMGRLIRARQIAVTTWGKGRCASACVFLYAAGVWRTPYGRVLIHRPYYLSNANQTYESTQRKYRDLELFAKKYLREMNVSESLFDRMMLIAPEDAETLTMVEMTKLGIGLMDPVYVEYLDNKKANAWGITKTEWLRKKRAVKAQCGDIDGVIPEGDNGKMDSCWNNNFPEYLRMPK